MRLSQFVEMLARQLGSRDVEQIEGEAGVAIDKKWIAGIRKGWKTIVGQLMSVNESHEGLDSLDQLDTALRYLALLQQDLFFGKGLYPFHGSTKTLKQRAKEQAPFNIQAKVGIHLEAAQEALEEGKRHIGFWRNITDRNSTEYKLDNGRRLEQILQDERFKGRSPGQSIAKFLDFQAPLNAKEAAQKADAEISGKLLRALSVFAGKYPGMDIGTPADREFTIGRMKVVFEDIPTKNLSGLSPEEIEKIRSPMMAKRYVKPLARAKALLDKKKLGFLWYGATLIQCKSCGGKNRLDTLDKVFGVGGRYLLSKDQVILFVNPDEYVTQLMIHELGHRYYYKFMSMADRAEFSSYFGQVPGVSDYGKTISPEDFAEVFAWYVLGRKLTRDQLERFKKFLGRKKQRGASTKDTNVAVAIRQAARLRRSHQLIKEKPMYQALRTAVARRSPRQPPTRVLPPDLRQATITERPVWNQQKRRKETAYFVGGKTFPVKDKIKRLGLKWSGDYKAWWTFDKARAEKANALLPGGGGSPSSPARSTAPKSSGGKATERQVQYAVSLIRNMGSDWHDTDSGQGMNPPSERELRKWSSRDVSDLIDELREEMGYGSGRGRRYY